MAVYTKLNFTQIKDHLKKYDIGELLDFKEIVAGIDNSNFIIFTQKGKFILTIFESRIDKNELPFFVNLKLHLAQKNICCPQPILTKNGDAIVELVQKKSMIASFLTGKNIECDRILPSHCEFVGDILAKLHLAAADFREVRENELGALNFSDFFAKIAKLTEDYQGGLSQEISRAIDFVEKNWRTDLESAPCHLDLFPDNVFFDENAKLSGVIDFYFAANDLLVYDFAIAVNAWCFDENNIFDQEKFTKLFDAYERNRKFHQDEKDFLKITCVAAALRFLLTRLHDMFFTPKDSLVNVKDPQEFLQKLRYFLTDF